MTKNINICWFCNRWIVVDGVLTTPPDPLDYGTSECELGIKRNRFVAGCGRFQPIMLEETPTVGK